MYIHIYILELDKGNYNTSKHISAMSRYLGLEKLPNWVRGKV
jgi:hypothetical protein